jgi:hypothetical protein
MIVFGVIIGFSISAQTNDEYVVVSYGSSTGVFTFSNNNFSLPEALARDSSPVIIARLCNYMYNNGYVLDQWLLTNNAFYMFIFRRK